MLPTPASLLAAVRDPAGTEQAITDVLPALAGHRYLLLTTMRRDGTPVATPVWFAAIGDRLVVTSEASAWKVKRLRHQPRATVAPCDARGKPLGPAVEVRGLVLADGESSAADEALARRYGTAYGAIRLLGRARARGAAPQRAFMALRLA